MAKADAVRLRHHQGTHDAEADEQPAQLTNSLLPDQRDADQHQEGCDLDDRGDAGLALAAAMNCGIPWRGDVPMLKIRAEQAVIFRQRASLRYDAKLAAYIEEEYPDFFILEEDAGARLRQFVEHAEGRGLKTRRLITMYVELAILFGEDALADADMDFETFVVTAWAAAFHHGTGA